MSQWTRSQGLSALEADGGKGSRRLLPNWLPGQVTVIPSSAIFMPSTMSLTFATVPGAACPSLSCQMRVEASKTGWRASKAAGGPMTGTCQSPAIGVREASRISAPLCVTVHVLLKVSTQPAAVNRLTLMRLVAMVGTCRACGGPARPPTQAAPSPAAFSEESVPANKIC